MELTVWHISDTHGAQATFPDNKIPEDIDILIHTGDGSNYQDRYKNEPEVRNTIAWLSSIKARYKIDIAGNHDTSIEHGLVKRKDFTDNGIIYLENEEVTIEGLKIWGSPITPNFGVGWSFNRSREKIHKVWDNIPEDTDIIATHGPPKGILDLSYDRYGTLEHCGCSNLEKRIREINPKAVLFGHIHNNRSYKYNAGVYISPNGIIYSNGSCVTDGSIGIISSYGNLLKIDV